VFVTPLQDVSGSTAWFVGPRARVGALCSQQLDAIDPLRVHFSLHDLGEYEACQAELPTLMASTPSKNFLFPVGRPATPETKLWTPELASMTQFFRTLFEFLPSLRQPLGAPPRGLLLAGLL
jgi:hypothetical protein